MMPLLKDANRDFKPIDPTQLKPVDATKMEISEDLKQALDVSVHADNCLFVVYIFVRFSSGLSKWFSGSGFGRLAEKFYFI